MACHSPAMRLTLFFNRMVFQSSGYAVSSLEIAEASQDILNLVCRDTGLPSSSGHLVLGIDLGFDSEDADSVLATAFKEFDLNTQKFKSGPVVVGVKSGSSNVLLSGGTAGEVDTPFEGYRYGLVTITLLENVIGGELSIEVVKLDGVTEESYKGLIALGFPADRRTSFRSKVRIPQASGVSQMTVVWKCWLFGKSAGDMPPLEMTIRRIPLPTTTPSNAPLTDSNHVLDTASLGTFASNQYAELTSDPLTVAPGDVLLFEITRPAGDGTGDGYADEVHILSQYLAVTDSE